MALNTNPFVEGIDPSATFGGYASVLLQLIRQAQPSSTYGMILFDTATPDVTGANAWRKRCIWVNLSTPGTPTVNVYKEGGSPGWSNVQALIPPLTITTAMIQNAAVTLAKLATTGGVANQLIRVNATATAFEFVSLSSLVVNGSINVGSLITTGIPAGQFRLAGTYGPGVANWYTAQNVIDNLANGVIASDLLAPAPTSSARSQFLSTRTADTTSTWRYFEPNVDIQDTTLSGAKLQNGTVALNKLTYSGAAEGSYLGITGGIPDWIPFPTTRTVLKYTSAEIALPTAGNTITALNHNLSGQPINVYGVLVCKTPEHGYILNDEIPLSQVYTSATNNESPVFYLHATTSQIHCVRTSTAGLVTANASNGNGASLTDGNWRLKFYALI